MHALIPPNVSSKENTCAKARKSVPTRLRYILIYFSGHTHTLMLRVLAMLLHLRVTRAREQESERRRPVQRRKWNETARARVKRRRAAAAAGVSRSRLRVGGMSATVKRKTCSRRAARFVCSTEAHFFLSGFLVGGAGWYNYSNDSYGVCVCICWRCARRICTVVMS